MSLHRKLTRLAVMAWMGWCGLLWVNSSWAIDTLKVCQDPHNPPFSDASGHGIENRLAELMGRYFGVPVEYYSFPQRMNFIRNTLRFKLPGEDFRCDIVMGLPVGFEQASLTRPYYRSTYALVVPSGRGWDDIRTIEDFLALPAARKQNLRVGIHDRSPASQWLHKHHFLSQTVPYPMLSPDPEQYPGQIIDRELVAGRIDVAVVWGPIAGYYAQRTSPPMRVIPISSEPDVRFDYAMAMGVRFGEAEWKKQVERFITEQHDAIEAVLRSFDVPLLPLPPP